MLVFAAGESDETLLLSVEPRHVFSNYVSSISEIWNRVHSHILWDMQISTMSMVVAAIVEVVRLGMVRRMDLYTSTAAVPMSVFWLVPQYFIIGAAEIMVNIGTLEMFYSEVSLIRASCFCLH